MPRILLITLLIAALAFLAGCPRKDASNDTGSSEENADVSTGDEKSQEPPEGGTATRPPADEAPGFNWGFRPATLEVYRDTRVSFFLDDDGGGTSASWRCRWDFGDGSPLAEGCRVEHLYRGGHSDQTATLAVSDGEKTLYEGSRKVPLERLPVVELDEGKDVVSDLSIPPPPKAGETSFRFVVVSDSAAPSHAVASGAQLPSAVEAIIDQVQPDFVVHNGNMVSADGSEKTAWNKAWAGFHETVTKPLRAAGIPLAPAPGDRDAGSRRPSREIFRAEWRKPENLPKLTMLDDSHYPLRWSFSHKGAFFLMMDGATGDVTEKQLRWIKSQLDTSHIYKLRFVFSHVPLHKFGDVRAPVEEEREENEDTNADAGGLKKHFRIYNMLQENNVSLFVSSHHEVYFKGLYGALRVVSTGNISGARRSLSGQPKKQPPSFVVVDVEAGRLKHVFAVAGPEYGQRFDEDELPAEVEVYRYDPTFTPGRRNPTPPAGLFSH